ncbi:MAG: YifB family Mg chelatase-like AAA ATPase [Gammaproteobacteria bacterium]
MSYCRIYSRASFGIEAPAVAVEIHLSNGLPALNIVGLANAEVKESRERVRSALLNSGFEFPARRITINLAPADLPKTGGRFDLAIAIGILIASEQLVLAKPNEFEFLAELGLNGELKPVSGILVASRQAAESGRSIWVAKENAFEAAMSGCHRVYSTDNLKHLVQQLVTSKPEPYVAKQPESNIHKRLCVSQIQGNEHAKLALCIAAAGGHNMLMIGTPGSGKTMLAERLPSIMPKLDSDAAFAVAALESVTHQGVDLHDWFRMRFRRPHHNCTVAAMTGGGKLPTPGEISLAHKGILFLDELPEFAKSVLESLRQPLEDRQLTVSRSNWKTTFPAHVQLIAAMNPCPCGYLTSQKTACRCSEPKLRSYLDKLSGPLLDRIDIQVMVNELDTTILEPYTKPAETSETIGERVNELRSMQFQRQGCLNADLDVKSIMQFKVLQSSAEQAFHQAVEKYNLSMRSQQKVLRLMLTVSDWLNHEALCKESLLMALSFRSFDQIHERMHRGLH